MADPRLATPSKRARRQRATIVFIDQSGFLLNPLVRRSLAPKGQTPILTVRGRHRQKVSVMAALALSPRRGRLGLLFRIPCTPDSTPMKPVKVGPTLWARTPAGMTAHVVSPQHGQVRPWAWCSVTTAAIGGSSAT